MRVLFDTNVVLDLMLDREPFALSAAQLFSKVETKELAGFLGATTVTTIHYLASKVVGAKRAQSEVTKLLKLFEIAPVNKEVLKDSLESNWSDFEDAVLYYAAYHANVQSIVSRNVRDFKKSEIPVYDPQELIRTLSITD